MFCPVCRSEYVEGVTHCLDCNVPLVSALPEVTKTRYAKEPLQHLTTAPNEAIARMWAEVLEKHGVHSMVRNEDYMPSGYVPAVGSAEIYVLAHQVGKARRILAPFTTTTTHRNR